MRVDRVVDEAAAAVGGLAALHLAEAEARRARPVRRGLTDVVELAAALRAEAVRPRQLGDLPFCRIRMDLAMVWVWAQSGKVKVKVSNHRPAPS